MHHTSSEEEPQNGKRLDREATPSNSEWSKNKIVKNIIVVCFAFLFNFTAFQALSNLQSSINCDEGLGLASLSCIYGALILSSLFLPNLLISYMGCKWTLTGGIFCYVLYTISNFYPQWYTLIPTSVILGFAAAPLWTAKGKYLTTTSIIYAGLIHENSPVVINRFYGIFFMMFQTSQIWGNLISSLVLSDDNNQTQSIVKYTCGAQDCQQTDENSTTFCDPPEKDLTNLLLGIYVASGCLAALIVIIFLDNLKDEKGNSSSNKRPAFDLFLSTIRLIKDKRMLLIIPITFYSGLEQAFITGDYTKSYVSCSIGIEMVGYVMICYGATNALLSISAGILAKIIGRVSLFAIGALVEVGLIITLYLWKPNEEDFALFFVFAAGWGLVDAVWQTQLNTLYGVLFSDRQEAAYSNYRLWESFGFTISFAYSLYLCVWIKLTILVITLFFSMILYFIVEYQHWKTTK